MGSSLWDNLFSENVNNIDLDSLNEQMLSFRDKMLNSKLSATALAEEYENLDERVLAYANSTDAANMSIKGFTAFLNQNTLAAKASKIALQGVALAGNMFVGWAISKGLEVVTTKLTETIHASEIAEEKSTEFATTLKSFLGNISSNASTIADLNEEYQTLSQGITENGENISLTAIEYDRYKEIISQISDIMPGLSTYFNAQGEKVGFLQGKLTDLNKTYEKTIQKQAQAFVIEGDGENNLQSILNDFNSIYDYSLAETTGKTLKNAFGIYDIEDVPVDTMLGTLKDVQNKSKEEISEYLKDVNLNPDGNYTYTESNRAKAILETIIGASSSEISKMADEEFQEIQSMIAENIENLQTNINVKMDKVRTALLTVANSKDSYWELDEGLRGEVSTFLSSINGTMWAELGYTTEEEIRSFISKIIETISTNKDGFTDAWNGLFSPEIQKLPVEEYIQQVMNFADTISKGLGLSLDDESKKDFLLSLGIDVDTSLASMEGLTQKLSVGVTGDEYRTLAEWIKTLNQSQLEIAHSDAFQNTLKKQKELLDNASLSAREYNSVLQDVLNAQEDTKPSSISDTIDQLSSQFEPAFEALANAYRNIFVMEDGTKKFTLENVDLSMIESIQNGVKQINEAGASISTSEFENFVKVLTDSSSTANDVQNIFNQMTGSICMGIGSITEENL